MSNGEENQKRVEILATTIPGRIYSPSKSFVTPGHVHVYPGDLVEFTATETDAKLIFPNTKLLDPKLAEAFHEKGFLKVESGDTLTIKINSEVLSGEYSYAVITSENKDLASGGSFPTFIVE